MTKISEWGPIIWNFFHTIVESIKDEKYNELYKELFHYIQSICIFLPCPQCSKHAKEYLKRVKDVHLSTKDGFRKMLFNFHNDVNKRNKKPMFEIEDITIYKNKSLIICYTNIMTLLTKYRNLQQLNQSFQRKMILQKLNNWMQKNKNNFHIK